MFRAPAVALIAALIAPLALAAPAAANGAEPHVMDAWVRLPAVSGRPAAGYVTAHGTATADALVGVSSPKAERIELHSVTMEGGVMRMRAETRLPLAAGGELKLAPGGNHLMLFGLAPDTQPGAKVPLTFRFQSGATVTVAAEARAAADGKPAGNAHSH